MKETIFVRVLGLLLLVCGAVAVAVGVTSGPALLALLGLPLLVCGGLCLVFGNL
ncbi:MAG: hypothetical protein LIO95_03720 [Clostridiales bacterium]|nr:hypothetical protein [Clostridiales bacterium]